MTERRKTFPDQTNESDKQFLDRTGVTSQLKDVLGKLIENRPEDPVSFLADYFEMVGDKVNRVVKAHQQICLTHHSKPAFDTNVRVAYDILTHYKIQRHVRGVNGSVYMELLHMITKDFPSSISEKLYKKIQCRDSEVVVYDVFKSGVFTCMVLKDFIFQVEELYKFLDPQQTSEIDRALCEAVAAQLQAAVRTADDTPTSVMEAGYMLGPSNLHDAISQALLQSGNQKKVMSSEEFVIIAADAFLSKVKPLK